MYFDKPYNRQQFLTIFQTKICPNFVKQERPLQVNRETKYFEKNNVLNLGNVEFDNWETLDVWEIKQISWSDPRVTITRDAFKIMKDLWKNNVLILFYSSDSSSYRLSFLTLKQTWDGTEESSPKRFSFLLWPNEKVKTPNDYLIKRWVVKSLEDLVSRFDVEVVRKEFFRLYLNLFIELYKSLRQNDDFETEVAWNKLQDPVKFAKNLMWKIIFLYFIQKKWRLWVKEDQQRWQWDMDFIKTLFDDSLSWENMIVDKNERKWNFYNDYLEPLFYGGLSQDRSKQNDVHPYFLWKNWEKIKIPYLNGWLFSNEYDRENTDILPDNKIFEDIILSFDRYNFTIDEDDPYDREVAIDPEMLGKIFETMISVSSENIDEILQTYEKKTKWNPLDIDNIQKVDIENDLNKKFWAFYTPREIVHYMTKESLLYYIVNGLKERGRYESWKSDQEIQRYLEDKVRLLLKYKENYLILSDVKNRKELQWDFDMFEDVVLYIDKLLDNIKVLDPAVWSWAFPMWLLHEIRSLKKYINDVFLKRNITNYEIKKAIISNNIYWVDIEAWAIDIARLRFWLSLLVDTEKPEPLPNLDFKFVCADTLTPLKGGSLFTNENLINKLDSLRKDYFVKPDKDDKAVLKKEFYNTKQELCWFAIKQHFTTTKEKKEYIENLARQNTDPRNRQIIQRDPFDTDKSSTFFDSGFMLGEEKFDIVIWNPPYIQLQKNEWYLANLYQDIWYKSFARTWDLYCLFYEHAFELLKEWWNCTFITSNKRMRAWYGEKLRDYLAKNTNPLMLVDLWPDVFDTATVDSNILIWQKKIVSEFHLKWLDLVKEKNIRNIEKLHDKIVEITELSKEAWTILDPIQASIKKKMEKIWTPLKDWNIQINYGIKTWYNEAFIIDKAKKDELISQDSKSAEIIKPILRGRDIRKYGYEFADLYLIVTHNGYKTTDWNRIERINIEDYPAVKDFLDAHRENISKRWDKWATPYNLRNCAYQEEFEKEKIVYSEISQSPCFCYDDKNHYLWNTWYILTWKYLQYLSCLLNSKLVTYWFKLFYSTNMWGKWYRYLAQYMENLPIPKISDEQQKPFIELVEKILKMKKENPDADTSELEKKIDQMVYELYGLSDEEAKVVEESLSK